MFLKAGNYLLEQAYTMISELQCLCIPGQFKLGCPLHDPYCEALFRAIYEAQRKRNQDNVPRD